MRADTDDMGEKHALFQEWALPHTDHVYTACLYLTRNKEEAEDLFQETFLRAFRFFHQFTPGTNCRAWLLTIMHNGFKNRAPQQRRAARTLEFDSAVYEYEKKLLADGESGKNDPAQLYQSQLVDHEITDALNALPEEYRATLLLVDIEDLSYEEAANVLDCPIGTVRSRLSRARRLLQKALSDYAQKRGYKKDQAKGQSSAVRKSSPAHVPSSSIKG